MSVQVGLPSLSNLNTNRRAPTGVHLVPGGDEALTPWNLSFTERVEPEGATGFKHVVHITAGGGIVDRQVPMLAALNERFNPVFENDGWTASMYSGELFTTCRDHRMSTLQWKVWKSIADQKMPAGGIPTVSMMPGGSVGGFLYMALGALPVDLAGVNFSWRQNPWAGVGTIAETKIILEENAWAGGSVMED
jgi:hypothetical protein